MDHSKLTFTNPEGVIEFLRYSTVSTDSEVNHQFAKGSNFLDRIPESIECHETLDDVNLSILGIHESSTIGVAIPHDLELSAAELDFFRLESDDAHVSFIFLFLEVLVCRP
jgi:hypothetical protein